MSLWKDVCKQALYMSFFTILIPIGAYTIHSGSSAVVAAVSYGFLSTVIPLAYVGMAGAAFGDKNVRIRRIGIVAARIIVAAAVSDTFLAMACRRPRPGLYNPHVCRFGSYLNYCLHTDGS